MKLIGLLGGMSWQSTIPYYRRLNEMVGEKLGKHHSARIVLLSIDYERIKQFTYDQEKERGDVLMDALLELSSFNPDCIIIGNNTLHKIYDNIAQHLYIDEPVLHVVEETCKYLISQKTTNVLLLGTAFTMENGFFADGLKKSGITSVIPEAPIRKRLQEIIEQELSKGIFRPETKAWIQEFIAEYEDQVDGVVLACTELPLIIGQADVKLPLANTVEIQCRAAVEFALS